MERSVKYILSIMLMVGASNALMAQSTSWELKKDEKGIKVYTRSVEGFDLDEFKGETTLNVPVEKIVEALKDVDKMPKWVPDCKQAKLQKMENENQYHYIETSVPFPLRNRDAVVHFQYIKLDNGIKVLIEGKPKYLPSNEGLVRIPYIKGYWLLVPIGEYKTSVTYQVHADPGGAIPVWLANATAVDTPYDTLKNLRDYLH